MTFSHKHIRTNIVYSLSIYASFEYHTHVHGMTNHKNKIKFNGKHPTKVHLTKKIKMMFKNGSKAIIYTNENHWLILFLIILSDFCEVLL